MNDNSPEISELEALRMDKDGAYLERNRLVALLAQLFPSGVKKTAIPGWSEDWHTAVYIDLPVGQVSWHFHDSQTHLLAGLPEYTKPWDGHTTQEKYDRILAFGKNMPQGKHRDWVDAAYTGRMLTSLCHVPALKAGWWIDIATGQPKDRNVGELLMLCVSELAEAMEGHRKGLMDDHLPHRKALEVELADTVIRVCDIAGGLGLDLGGAIADKLQFNAQREDHTVAHRQGEHGKKY